MQPLSNDLRQRGSSQSVSLELDTSWDYIVSAVRAGIQSRSQKR
jgi:hypothetical protein